MAIKYKSNLDMQGNKITNLSAPSNDDDACNKAYVTNYVSQEIQDITVDVTDELARLDAKIDDTATNLSEEITTETQAVSTTLSEQISEQSQEINTINGNISTLRNDISNLQEQVRIIHIPKEVIAADSATDITDYLDGDLFEDIYFGRVLPLINKEVINSSTNTVRVLNCTSAFIEKQKPETYMLGDINRDGVVDINDWNLLYTYINETATLTRVQMELADVNQDGKVNVKDWNRIYEYIEATSPTPFDSIEVMPDNPVITMYYVESIRFLSQITECVICYDSANDKVYKDIIPPQPINTSGS